MKNVAESIKTRLKEEGRRIGVSVPFMQLRYVNERFLARLASSQWANDYCLKGGMLLPVWNEGDIYRPTSDIDLNGIAEGDLDTFTEAVKAISAMGPEELGYDDGVVFDITGLKRGYEKEGGKDGGKLTFDAYLGNTKLRVRIDLGFGNAITPSMVYGEYPSLFDKAKKNPLPRPSVYMYPPETMIAEKLHALAHFGAYNTRTRDYYDLFVLLERMDLDDEVLAVAISRTFANYDREIELELPGLSDKFIESHTAKWDSYVSEMQLASKVPDLRQTVETIRDRVRGPFERALELGAPENAVGELVPTR